MSEYTIEGDDTMRWDVIASTPHYGFKVTTGVHGAVRTNERWCATEDEARARALRWSQSNSTGHYWAQVHDADDVMIGQYN